MAEENPSDKKSAAENFGDMLKEFGSAVAEIFNDPELKNKAREFGESAKESAKTFASRFKDDEVKGKFKDVGNAAHNFGESVSDYFKQDKRKEGDFSQKEDLKNESHNTDASENEDSKKKLNEENNIDQVINSEKEINSETVNSKDIGYDSLNKSDFKKASNEFDGRFDNYFKSPKAGRITGYVFAIAFSLAWLIFVNFFYRFIAFYNHSTINGVGTLKIVPVFTDNIKYWLPFFTISIGIGILGNIILIIYERFYLAKIIAIITNLFFIAATATLLQLFPFDFSGIPFEGLRTSAPSITIAVLVIIIVCIGIGVIVNFIKLIIFFARSGSTKE
ncbi:MAG: hypothetical protein ACYCZ1_08400 [Candidatus Humimicrobiaceae bacterium]